MVAVDVRKGPLAKTREEDLTKRILKQSELLHYNARELEQDSARALAPEYRSDNCHGGCYGISACARARTPDH